MASYFSKLENKKKFSTFVLMIGGFIVPDNPSQRLDPSPYLVQLFNLILSQTEKTDELCEYNIKHVGSRLLDLVSSFISESSSNNSAKIPETSDSLLKIFAIAYRFLLEIEFKQGGNVAIEFLEIKNWVNKELQRFPEDIRQILVWANYIMLSEITRDLINHPNIETFREYILLANNAKDLRDSWNKEIETKRKEVDILKQNLEQYQTEYNFVGLVDGFKNLLDQKRKERRLAFLSLLGIGVLILLPLSAEIGFILYNINSLESIKSLALFILPSTIALQIFLFYFFRIVLIHFRTVKAHILQLDLRVSLCQFIQSYAKYAAEIKKSDSASLEKFESLIFSGIVSNDEKLPSTLDGLDQLSSLFKSVQGK